MKYFAARSGKIAHRTGPLFLSGDGAVRHGSAGMSLEGAGSALAGRQALGASVYSI